MTIKSAIDSKFVRWAYDKIQPAKIGYHISPELTLKILFKILTGYKLDLKNPKTFNEKIQWLKLYDSTPLKTKLADKYLVKDWVAEKIGREYVIPTLGVYDSFDKIDFDELPNQFVLKTNHGSAMNVIVKDKSKLNKTNARKIFNKWLKENIAWTALEMHYLNIKPKIIAEEYLENINGELTDYKFHCFSGEVEYIQCMTGRASKETLREKIYDTEWNALPFVQNYPRYEGEIAKPKDIPTMVTLSEKLAEGFSYVRVDFYALDDGSIKFGEMTFTPGSGTGPWNIEEYNKKYGELIICHPT